MQLALDTLHSVRAGVLVCDQQGHVLLHNPAAATILGLPEFTEANVEDILAPVEVIARHALQRGRRTEIVLRQREPHRVVGYEVATDRGGRLVVMFQDITQQVRLREERDRLLQFATLGEVLPSVFHELRNPLAAVTSATELLLEDVEARGDDELTFELHTILAELRRMELVFQGIGSAGRRLRSTQLAAVDLATEEVVTIMKRRAGQSGVEITCEVHSLPLLPVDPAAFKAIAFNLVNNALYACKGGDRIALSVRLSLDQVLCLTVRDTGRGMSPTVLAACTKPFFTTRVNGSGLGLMICKEITEEAGGELEIVSAPGRGTLVTVTIPLRSEP